MQSQIEDASLSDRFTHLLNILSDENFLKKKGLGNEVPFFICPFRKREEYKEMEVIQTRLANRLEKKGIGVLHVNLYDLTLDLLKDRNRFDTVLEQEEKKSKEQLLEFFQGITDPEKHLVPAIANKMAEGEFDVMFVGGVGEVYPYIRTHTVLNNLQSVAKEKPTLLFFPGEYNYSLEHGSSLDLFGRLRDDKYYRAFNIYSRHY